jgi:hypothetical protein
VVVDMEEVMNPEGTLNVFGVDEVGDGDGIAELDDIDKAGLPLPCMRNGCIGMVM